MRPQPSAVDLLVAGASELATPRGSLPLSGADLERIALIEKGAVAIRGDRIVAVGPEAELARAYAPERVLDARGGTIIPGFVDAHTHPVFAGTREGEFELRTRGKSYLEIARDGGGIVASVRGVRAATEEELLDVLLVRMQRFLELGTTTIEAKTGYGLSLEDELKCLAVLAEVRTLHPVRRVVTFLGAHAFPPEYGDRRQAYVDLLVEEMLPRVAEGRRAEFCDVFTETLAFDLEETRRILTRARDLGLDLRLHADQLSPMGAAELAAELRVASADHLEHVSERGIEALAGAGVIAVLCPLVPLVLRQEKEAPARRLIAAGVPPALSTDFNPGSCYVQGMPEVLAWAALRYRMTAAECLTAATLNAACSLGLGEEIGSLEAGKCADLVVLDQPNHRHLGYEFGRNPVRAVVVGGRVRVEREERDPRLR